MNHKSIADAWLGLRGKPFGEFASGCHPPFSVGAPDERLPPDVHPPLSVGAPDDFQPRLSGPTVYPTICGAMCKDQHRAFLWVTKMRGEMASRFNIFVDASGGSKATAREALVGNVLADGA